MPDQTGKIAIVTGANSGLGYESAQALIRRGAHVVIACRNQTKAGVAYAQLEACAPETSLDSIPLDLSSLDSVRDFAESFRARYDRLDILLNNAGVMAPPRGETADGFEMQFGTNHLGHFALTGRLMDTLLATPASRVVTVSSFANLMGRIAFDDLQSTRGYQRYAAYMQSKLANLMFAFELQRRLELAGADTISVAAQPGLAHTNLQSTTAEASGSKAEGRIYDLAMGTLSMPAEQGALPQLYAATMPGVRGGEYYSPDFLYFRGYPTTIAPPVQARSQETAERLWGVSETLTGVVYPLPAA
jgi:NAD(P)-dependent dehydrogenase (short-subunit alcohol dehydrogenase family)